MKSLAKRLKLPASPERAFFYFLTIVFVGISIQVVASNQAMRQPLRLTGFVLLMVLHILIHWLILWLEEQPKWIPYYILGQGLIALVLCLMSGALAIIFGTYLALIGQVVGIFSNQRWKMAAAIGYLILLSMVSYGLIFGWSSIQWWALGVFPMVLFVYIYVTLYGRQIYAREQAQKLLVELEGANQQLTEYAARVEDLTIAAERQRMARELHDTLSQGLAGLILQLEAADAHLANKRFERAQAIVKQAMQQARSTLADARRAIDDLRTASSSPESTSRLEEIVRQEAERFTNATGVPCTVEVDLPTKMPEPASETAKRAVQEGLANIARHAHATQARLRLKIEEERLVVEVSDDGRGFEPESISAQAGHYGLLGMQERARLAGGNLLVTSAPGKGSLLKLTVPLAGKE